jgi:hypothetical protein
MPSFGPRMGRSSCGKLGATAVPNRIEQAERLPGGAGAMFVLTTPPTATARVEQQRHHQDKPTHHILVAGAEQHGEISDRANVGFGHAALALNARLPDLKDSQRLGLGSALGDESALPDRFIEYLPSLLGQAIQYYSCFINYSFKFLTGPNPTCSA